MSSLHPPAAFYRGDTWKIAGALYNADGTPYDLSVSGVSLQWMLVDLSGNQILELSIGNGISIVNATAGQCLITVTDAQSGAIAVGDYCDWLRAQVASSDTDTMWTGFIAVKATPFAP